MSYNYRYHENFLTFNELLWPKAAPVPFRKYRKIANQYGVCKFVRIDER